MRAGEPSRTAFGAATHRAVHQDLEQGRVFSDPLAWRILGMDPEPILAEARAKGRNALRMFIAVRHRFAEDSLAAAVARGTRQVVVLGAGLDTFGYRNRDPEVRVFEVDHPDTGPWKRERLDDAGIPVPATVTYVGVDFERDDVLRSLAGHGFDSGRPAFFMWLGVVPYLSGDAVRATLRRVASVPDAEVVFDYPTRTTSLDGDSRALRAALHTRVASVGEPMLSSFAPEEMAELLLGLGYAEVEDLGRAEILPRFFGVDPAGVRATGGGHVVRARAGSSLA